MAKKSTETTERVVTLNNKSRKGTYLYIKEPTKKGRYYKIKTEQEKEAIKQYHKDKYTKRRKTKGTIHQYKKAYTTPTPLKKGKTWKKYKISPTLKKQAQKYLKLIQKRPTISEAIKKGLTQTTINNIHQTTQKTIKEAHKQLLQDLIIDKKLLDIITTPENTKKLASRYENKITIILKDGNKITATKYNTTPEQIINELKKELKTNTELQYPERTLKKLGYATEGKTEKGTIQQINLTITFRKGE